MLPLLAFLMLLAQESPSALRADSSGWTDLLADAGPGLNGWTRSPIHPGDTLDADSQWSLDPKTGNLVCEGNGGHEWLRYDKEFGDFIYHVEWRYSPVDKKGYNSGLYVRNSADAKVWHQIQIGSASGGYLFGDTLDDGKLKSFNFSKSVTDQRVKPAGQWNVFEITCKGREITVWANGAVMNAWHDCPVPSGFLGVEADGFRIEFRNMKVKPL
jgi:hypothetical protein